MATRSVTAPSAKTPARTGAHAPAFLATMFLYGPDESGREHAVWSGWHCRLRLPSGLVDAMVVVEGRETVAPGAASPVRVFLSDPDAVEPQWLVAETVLEVLEDEHVVGKLQIFEPLAG